MSEKTLKTRIQNKRGTTAEWATGTAPNFIPKDGEIVAYTDVHRIKIGDGTTKVSALPFVDKVSDVTLGGESMVNANGVVELQQTVMTNGYVPVWNNTEGIFEDGIEKSNIVTIDTNQTITGSKTFTGTLSTEGVSAKFTNAVIGGDNGCILDCYELQGTGDSIFSVYAKGVDKGEVNFGDGSVDVNITLGQYTYISSNVILGASSTSYPRSTVSAAGMTILSSSTVATNYGATSITRQSGNNGYTISLPSGNGTLALTNQIPIKTATLSGTTLSITLS